MTKEITIEFDCMGECENKECNDIKCNKGVWVIKDDPTYWDEDDLNWLYMDYKDIPKLIKLLQDNLKN